MGLRACFLSAMMALLGALVAFASADDVVATHILDLKSVYTVVQCDDKPGTTNQTFLGIPTDPSPDPHEISFGGCPTGYHLFTAWTDYTVGQAVWVYIGVWDWSRGIWVADDMQYRNAGTYSWVSALTDWEQWTKFKNLSECSSNPGADFTRCADVYEVYAYYWWGSQWIFADKANGLVLADWDWSGDDPDHFHWSPNSYDRPTKVLSYTTGDGKDWVEVRWRFAYYDGMPTNEGTNRLNRLKDWASGGLFGGGAWQVEMRRNSDGWDAAEVGWTPFTGCYIVEIYDWWSTVPGFSVGYDTVEESLPSEWNPQVSCEDDEEAEGKSSDWSNLSAMTISDASQAMSTGPWWHYKQTFLRREARQGYGFRLQTEFELKEPWPDTSFDVVIATQRAETY